MDSFFLQHSVLRDRDQDELDGRRIDSDSEASDAEEEITDRVRSVADPTGPWRQTPVGHDSGWGQPKAPIGGRAPRSFASAHTGPKGVISDYKAHKRHQRQERERKEVERQQALLRVAKGAAAADPQEIFAHQQLQQQQDSDGDDEDDLTDPSFMEEYRRQRIAQLQAAARSRIVFGELEYVEPERFVQLVDLAAPSCLTLVHLYDPESYACGLLNRELELLANKLVHIKFSAMVARQADPSIAVADLPILMVYRGSTLLETVVHVTQALNNEFTSESVEAFVRTQIDKW